MYSNILLGVGNTARSIPEVITLGANLTMTGNVLSAAAGGGLSDGDKGDITVSGSGTNWTIDNNVVTDAKLRDSGACSVIGRRLNSAGDPGDLSASANGQYLRRASDVLGFGAIAAGDLPSHSHTLADITDDGALAALNSVSTGVIDDDAVTNAKLANMNNNTIKGNNTGGAANPVDLTGTQATAILDNFVGDSGAGGTKGLVPAPAAGDAAANKYLKANGSWAAVSATGDGLGPDGDKGDVTVGGSGTTLTIDNDAVTYAKMQNVSATSRVLGRKTGGAGDPEECTLSEVLDFIGAAAQGDILYRGAASWARLGAGTSGHFLKTNGAGADPAWAAATATDPDGYTYIVKSANQDVTNAGLTNDSELSFAVVAGGHYAISMDLIMSANNTTGDYTMDFTVSAGTQKGKGTCQNLTAAAAVQNIIVTAAGVASTTAIVTGAPTADIDDLVHVRVQYAFTASSNATLNFRFGNASAGAGRTSRTWKGTVLRYKRLD